MGSRSNNMEADVGWRSSYAKEHSRSKTEPAKITKMWPRFEGSPLWPATWVGHELGGSAPHHCRWADVVWAPRCRDCVMDYCRVWSYFIDLSFLVNSPTVTLIILGLGFLRARLLRLCSTAAFPPIFLQLRKGPLWSCAELLQRYALCSSDRCT